MNIFLTLCSFLLTAQLAVVNAGTQSAPALPADSTLGKIVKIITTSGQFVSFDKDHLDHAFINDANGMSMNLIFGAPEMDCFLANHQKDNLSYTYEIHENLQPDGKRLNLVKRIVSLKTGDDTRTWQQKESQDSTTMARHHAELTKLRTGRQY